MTVGAPVCRYPGKHLYASARAAKRGRAGLYRNRAAGQGRLVIFPCGDHWHVGHKRGGR